MLECDRARKKVAENSLDPFTAQLFEYVGLGTAQQFGSTIAKLFGSQTGPSLALTRHGPVSLLYFGLPDLTSPTFTSIAMVTECLTDHYFAMWSALCRNFVGPAVLHLVPIGSFILTRFRDLIEVSVNALAIAFCRLSSSERAVFFPVSGPLLTIHVWTASASDLASAKAAIRLRASSATL